MKIECAATTILNRKQRCYTVNGVKRSSPRDKAQHIIHSLSATQLITPLRPTGGGEHEERAEDLDSSQGVRDHLVAYHLAPAITDFISDENRVCCINDLEQKPTLLHSEWSKEIEPSGQSSKHHPLVGSNPIDKKGLEIIFDLPFGFPINNIISLKVWSSCVEACGGKRPRCQHLHMTLHSFVSKKRH